MGVSADRGTARLLACVLAMVMVACAVIAVIPGENVAADSVPSAPEGKELTGEIEIATAESLLDKAAEGVIYVGSAGLIITLTDDIGSDESPVNVGFVLRGDLTIKSETGEVYDLYIASDKITVEDVNGNPCSSVVSWASNGTFAVESVNLTMDNVSTKSPTISLFNSNYGSKVDGANIDAAGVKITDSTVTFMQSGSVAAVGDSKGTGSAWLQSVDGLSVLTVNNSTVNFNGVGAFMDTKIIADKATFNLNDVEVGLIVAEGSEIKNSTYALVGSQNQGIDFKGKSTVTGSTISITDAQKSNGAEKDRPDVMLHSEAEITFTDSTLNAGEIRAVSSYDGLADDDIVAPKITGGTIVGDLEPAISAVGTPIDNTEYNLTGTSFGGKSAIEKKVEVIGSTIIPTGAELSVYGKLTATTENNGVISVKDKDATIPDTITGSGNVDTSAISADAELSGDFYDVTTYGVGQTITVNKDTTLLSGTQITIKGKIIINEGVTLRINDGAQLVLEGSMAVLENNGAIIVESDVAKTDLNKDKTAFGNDGGLNIQKTATLINYGTLETSYSLGADETVSKYMIVIGSDSTIRNEGIVTISGGSQLYISATNGAIDNSKGATLNLYGNVSAGAGAIIDNSGTVSVEATVTTLTINNCADGATVSIVSVSGKLTVTDAKMTADNIDAGVNTISFEPTKGTIGGIVIASSIVKVDKVAYRTMDISGAAAIAANDGVTVGGTDGATASIEMTVSRAVVSTDFAIGNGITLTASGKLDVSGTMTFQTGSTAKAGNTAANVTVTGTIISPSPLENVWTMNAAMYRVMNGAVPTYYYTTLANAIAAGATAITVTGQIEVLEDIAIPSGTTVTQKDGKITIGSKDDNTVTVTVATGGKIDQKSGQIDVLGTLHIEDKKNGVSRNPVINSEVLSEGETDITYTNLANAIANAGTEPVTITLNGPVTLTRDMTIPENVTVDTEGETFTVIGATLTIDGTLYLNDTAANSGFKVTDDNSGMIPKVGKVVLNGYIKSNGELVYTDGKTLPAGAYYVGGEDSLNYITSVSNSPAVIATAEDRTVNICGTNTAADVAYTGTADAPVTVNVKGKLTADITLSYADLVFFGTQGQEFDGTIATAEGSVAFASAIISGTFSSKTVDDAVAFVVEATVNSKDAQKYSAVFDGETSVSGQFYGMTVDGTVNASALRVTGDATVTGTMNVANGTTLTIEGAATVTGTLNVAEVTETQAAGSAEVGELYVGIQKTTVGDKTTLATAAAGTVSGSIAVSGSAYVSADSTVPESMTKATGKYVTGFYVEDALWMTVYGTEAYVPNAPVTDAKFGGWDDPSTEDKDRVDKDGEISSLANLPRLDAIVDYNVYYIEVYTDGGISSVAIDGVLLMNEGNKFYNVDGAGFKAGEHKLSYTIKNGFTGEATMTIGGQAVSGDTFTLGGDYNVKTVINLAGTEPVTSGEIVVNTGSDDMSLTDILLIVLVVLIVIMAIIVALRLMRS